MRRSVFALIALGLAVGLAVTTIVSPRAVLGEEVPAELKAEPPTPTPAAKDLSRPFIDATRRVRPAVVKVVNFQRDWNGRLRQASGGSGFVISKQGHVLTNRHVVLNAVSLLVELEDGRRFTKVKVLGADPGSDVAIVRILDATDEDLPIAVLGDSDRLEVGEWVIAIGSPFELDSSVSVGVVSAVGRTGVLRGLTPAEEFIQTDASLNPGNSGGPLINLDGQVVGINTAIQTGGMTRSSAGVGFAIPINLVRSIAASLIERGIARRGRLGVRFERNWVPAEELEKRGIDAQRGIRVEHVEPDSPAAAAGLEKGDIITAVDGRPIKSIQILFARLTQAGPGGTLSLLVHGAAGTRTAEVTLGEAAVVTYGIEVADLAPSRAAELGLPPDARGALVTKVKKGSKAAAGDRIMPGDVIVRVDWPGGRQLIASRKDFVQVMAHLEQEAPRRVRLIFRTKDGLFETSIDP